jgi:endonuclease/exonuclease/phosphatase family metal-dependent hydrolase
LSATFRIATVNIWALPFYIADSVSDRVDAIARRLGELDADVVAFQEVWIGEVRQRLVAAGVDSGYPEAWYDPETTGGGLLVLSRYPILEARFHVYLLRGLPQRPDQGEYYAGKGFLHLRLDTKRGPVSVLNTHLHAQYASATESDYFGIQTGQIVQLSAYLAGLSDPVFAPGDFNVHERSAAYRVLLGLSGLEDSAVTLDHRQATVRRSNPYREGKIGPDSRVDYVLYRSGATQGVRPVSIERIFDDPFQVDGGVAAYSDHDGLLAKFQLTDQSDHKFAKPKSDIVELAGELLEAGRVGAEQRQMHKRVAAGACLVAGSLPFNERFRSRLSRRRFLKGVSLALPALAFPSGAGLLTLSEVFVPQELAAYDRLLALLGTTWAND